VEVKEGEEIREEHYKRMNRGGGKKGQRDERKEAEEGNKRNDR